LWLSDYIKLAVIKPTFLFRGLLENVIENCWTTLENYRTIDYQSYSRNPAIRLCIIRAPKKYFDAQLSFLWFKGY
jgi:hypothetical protein